MKRLVQVVPFVFGKKNKKFKKFTKDILRNS